MSLRDILQHPESKLLRKRSREVSGWDEPGLEELITDLGETAKSFGAPGLAAIQLGIAKRVVVLSIDDGTAMPYINPSIVKGEGRIIVTETCPSVPGKRVRVERYRKVEFTHLDRSGATRLVKVIHPEFAVAIQHELDHFNGVLIVDRAHRGVAEARPS